MKCRVLATLAAISILAASPAPADQTGTWVLQKGDGQQLIYLGPRRLLTVCLDGGEGDSSATLRGEIFEDKQTNVETVSEQLPAGACLSFVTKHLFVAGSTSQRLTGSYTIASEPELQ